MSNKLYQKFIHTITVGFAIILVLATAVVYGIIKNSPLPSQKSVAGISENISDNKLNLKKKQRNQTQEEYLKKKIKIDTEK